MKINICDSLRRRSVDNDISTFRHNKREDRILEVKFSQFKRQFAVIDQDINLAERRFEKQVKTNFGLSVIHKAKPIEPSMCHSFYYPSTKRDWTTKEFLVRPYNDIIRDRRSSQNDFERRSQNYIEQLKRRTTMENIRKDALIYKIDSLVHDDCEQEEQFSLKLPPIHRSKSMH